jgi:hypothetical protein
MLGFASHRLRGTGKAHKPLHKSRAMLSRHALAPRKRGPNRDRPLSLTGSGADLHSWGHHGLSGPPERLGEAREHPGVRLFGDGWSLADHEASLGVSAHFCQRSYTSRTPIPAASETWAGVAPARMARCTEMGCQRVSHSAATVMSASSSRWCSGSSGWSAADS